MSCISSSISGRMDTEDAGAIISAPVIIQHKSSDFPLLAQDSSFLPIHTLGGSDEGSSTWVPASHIPASSLAVSASLAC